MILIHSVVGMLLYFYTPDNQFNHFYILLWPSNLITFVVFWHSHSLLNSEIIQTIHFIGRSKVNWVVTGLSIKKKLVLLGLVLIVWNAKVYAHSKTNTCNMVLTNHEKNSQKKWQSFGGFNVIYPSPNKTPAITTTLNIFF